MTPQSLTKIVYKHFGVHRFLFLFESTQVNTDFLGRSLCNPKESLTPKVRILK